MGEVDRSPPSLEEVPFSRGPPGELAKGSTPPQRDGKRSPFGVVPMGEVHKGPPGRTPLERGPPFEEVAKGVIPPPPHLGGLEGGPHLGGVPI